MSIHLYVGDEQPPWVITEKANGAATDFSTGWTFTCKVFDPADGTLKLTKTSGITGAAAGQITVTFTGAELVGAGVTATFAQTVTTWGVTLKATHATFGDITIKDKLSVEWVP